MISTKTSMAKSAVITCFVLAMPTPAFPNDAAPWKTRALHEAQNTENIQSGRAFVCLGATLCTVGAASMGYGFYQRFFGRWNDAFVSPVFIAGGAVLQGAGMPFLIIGNTKYRQARMNMEYSMITNAFGITVVLPY